MSDEKPRITAGARKRKLREAIEILESLGFSGRQANEVAAYTLLALVDLSAGSNWAEATNPLRGITPIIDFIGQAYNVHYAEYARDNP